MFERFTDKARRVVVHAQRAAREVHDDHIRTEYLLVGLCEVEESMATAVLLDEYGITTEVAWQRIAEVFGHVRQAEPTTAGGSSLPFTDHCKKVLELALREALGLGHNYIGTEHILLALYRSAEPDILALLGPTDEHPGARELRDAIMRRLVGVREPRRVHRPVVQKTVGEATVVELLQHVRERISRARASDGVPSAGREASIALTSLEDAQMRYVRMRSIEDNRFHEHDPDAPGA